MKMLENVWYISEKNMQLFRYNSNDNLSINGILLDYKYYCFYNLDHIVRGNDYKIATSEQILNILKDVAIKYGFVHGITIDMSSINKNYINNIVITTDNYKYDIEEDILSIGNLVNLTIYEKGKWSKIVKTLSTLTDEELLNNIFVYKRDLTFKFKFLSVDKNNCYYVNNGKVVSVDKQSIDIEYKLL
jgi:hypothetical protein